MTECRGNIWRSAFGLDYETILPAQRHRYVTLKKNLVFQMDALGDTDPLTALTTSDSQVTASSGLDKDWTQYFTDEPLLLDIKTDLDRLYPSGNETLFQNPEYLDLLRHILFIWCKLHPSVSYRQGMHDVAAVVLFAFIYREDKNGAVDDADSNEAIGHTQSDKASAVDSQIIIGEHTEADVYLVFEAIMVYLEPFYEVVKTNFESPDKNNNIDTGSNSNIHAKSRFKSCTGIDNDVDSYHGKDGKRKPALHRLCHHIQYDILQQTDPQLFYHLQNLEIIPETYCLRWIRLLFAREYTLQELLDIWDGLIHDKNRPDIKFPTEAFDIPVLQSEDSEKIFVGFPLLPFVCVAKLLSWSKELLQSDNTGCLIILMQTNVQQDMEGHGSTKELIALARRLQDPTIIGDVSSSKNLDVVRFDSGSLGIILTSVDKPHENRIAVKDFVSCSNDLQDLGQAEKSGRIFIGDLLESINGVKIINMTTEEVKRHIRLLTRPIYIGFEHVSNLEKNSTMDRNPTTNAINVNTAEPTLPTTVSDVIEDTSISSPSSSAFKVMLPGEMCYAKTPSSMQNLTLSPRDDTCLAHYLSGTLFVTNYRLFFTPLLTNDDIVWQVPVLSIESIDSVDSSQSNTGGGFATTALDQAQLALGYLQDSQKQRSSQSSSQSPYEIVLKCKDMQFHRLSFSNFTEFMKVSKCVSCLAFPNSLLDVFCFSYAPTFAPSEVFISDIRMDYQRIGLLDDPATFRCLDQSTSYDLCDTYPQYIIVPAGLTDDQLKGSAAFRSHHRLPVVCWQHRENGACIVRTSQPLVGMKSARSIDDELLVRLLCCASSPDSYGRYVIMDARGQLAIVGNKAMGKGTEITSNYRGSRLQFMNLENIHSIRTSYQQLINIFEPPQRGKNSEYNSNTLSFHAKLEASGWLKHVQKVLKASIELAYSIHNGVSVLTHCSDGWDRTTQMVSLAELMLDPYYRTIRGFQTLVEKEWVSFGHQFRLRSGHARQDISNDQRSPIFLLWLDCVWQCTRQLPVAFEFNEALLILLADHVYSGKYGTFMFDSEKQRRDLLVSRNLNVVSIWSDIYRRCEVFTNPFYVVNDVDPLILSPSTLSVNIRLWKGYFCRWDITMVPPVAAKQFY